MSNELVSCVVIVFSEALLDSAVHERDLDGVEACGLAEIRRPTASFVVSTTHRVELVSKTQSWFSKGILYLTLVE